MSIKKDDIEELKFESLLADKRHNEVSNLLKAITDALAKDDNNEVVEAINKQGDNFGELIKAIKSIPKTELPEVNVNLNPTEFVDSINKICEEIIKSNDKVIEALNTRLLPDTFTLIKTYAGITESVKVNYKEARLINQPANNRLIN